MDAIRTEHLTKRFDDLVAVNDVDLQVAEGEILGLLGPNGAGKTTTLNILSTLMRPTSGNAFIHGIDVVKQPDKVRRRIGVVFQDPSLDDELTGLENLRFHARLYKVPRSERDARIDELLALVELEDRKDDRVRTYSGGMRRRLELARGLVHQPKLLFLDEPTLGLDPQTREHLWTYIRRLNKERNVTMVLTTHYMEEADLLCNRVAIIDHGKIVALDTPNRLKSALGGDVLYIRLEGARDGVVDALSQVESVSSVRATSEGIQIEAERGDELIPKALDLLRAGGHTVSSIQLQKPTLNDVFIRHTGHAIREESMGSADRMSYYMRSRRH